MAKSTDSYIQGIVQQNGKVLRHIYDDFFPRIKLFILKNSGNEQDAQDVFQEAIMIIYTKASKPDFALSCAFYTYLHSISRNIWLHQLREKRKLSVTYSPDWEYIGQTDFEETLIEQEQFSLYWKKFKALGADCRKLLDLFFQGKPMTEITLKMGYGSPGYARKRKFQCKEQLLKMISEDPDYKAGTADGR